MEKSTKEVYKSEESSARRDASMERMNNIPYNEKEHRAHLLRKDHDRVSHSAMHKAAEELRMEGKGSVDPMYEDSRKNK